MTEIDKNLESFRINHIAYDYAALLADRLEAHNDTTEIPMFTGIQAFDEHIKLKTGKANRILLKSSSRMANKSFLLSLVLGLMKNGMNVLLYSSMMSKKTVMDRLVSMVSGVSYKKLFSGTCTPLEIDELRKAISKIQEFNGSIIEDWNDIFDLLMKNSHDIIFLDESDKIQLERDIECLHDVNVPAIATYASTYPDDGKEDFDSVVFLDKLTSDTTGQEVNGTETWLIRFDTSKIIQRQVYEAKLSQVKDTLEYIDFIKPISLNLSLK